MLVWISECAGLCLELEKLAMTEHTKPVKVPDNWDANGTSKGKSTGPVRPTPDASRPKK